MLMSFAPADMALGHHFTLYTLEEDITAAPLKPPTVLMGKRKTLVYGLLLQFILEKTPAPNIFSSLLQVPLTPPLHPYPPQSLPNMMKHACSYLLAAFLQTSVPYASAI
jgi:hypothetical protein